MMDAKHRAAKGRACTGTGGCEMRILLLGNSLTTANGMPRMLAEITGAEVVCHTRGGARLAEHLKGNTRLGAKTQAALREENWDCVVLQEMSHGPFTATEQLLFQRRAPLQPDTAAWGCAGAVCHLGL